MPGRARALAGAAWLPVLLSAYAGLVLVIALNEASGVMVWLAPFWVLLVVAPLLVLRRRPLTGAAVLLAGSLLLGLAEPRAVLVAVPAVCAAVSVVAARSALRPALVVLALALAGAAASALPEPHRLGGLAVLGTTFGCAWAVGSGVGAQRRRTEAAVRASTAEAEARLAGVRLMLARDLHDAVAHDMTVVTVQAGLAGLVLDSDPAAARRAMAAVEQASRDALGQLRAALDVLRVPSGGPDAVGETGLAPSPGLADLPELIERVRATGLAVTVREESLPPYLPTDLQLCTFRVVQEALTNVVRHAGASRATVSIAAGPGELRVVVADDGSAAVGRTVVPGGGLVGMRERVGLLGGTTSVTSRPDGGLEVRAALPLPAGAAAARHRPDRLAVPTAP
jgi:signal transduction histidine kinase